MRRLGLVRAVAVGGCAALLLAACSRPAGVDGKIADDWSGLPDAKSWAPAANTCHASGFMEFPTYARYEPVDCAQPHTIETVHVGAFPDRPTPPPEGSPERRTAYGECLTKSTDFLGDDWRAGRLWLGLAVPSTNAWTGGARWFRCDLWEIKSKDDQTDIGRTGSLKDGLRGSKPVGYGCYVAAVKNDKVESMTPSDCTKPHNAEFAGVFVAPDVTYPKTAKERDDLAFNGCRGVAARFANVPNDANFFFRTGLIITPYSEKEWALGNRGIRCHLWLPKNVSKSLRGAGAGALPTQ